MRGGVRYFQTRPHVKAGLLAEAVSAASGGRVLDVGCGTGGTTLAIARLLGDKGHCVGIDISGPMIAAARLGAEREGTSATVIRADAQVYAFEPATFDTIVSRFGVMFFDEPVGAFANLGRLPDPARSPRTDSSRGGRTDAHTGHRDGPRRL